MNLGIEWTLFDTFQTFPRIVFPILRISLTIPNQEKHKENEDLGVITETSTSLHRKQHPIQGSPRKSS